jgi:hypothetical protein
MSRSGYTDDFADDQARYNCYRANVDRALRGKRGQAFLREMAAALDAMPIKELVADEIVRDSTHVCAIGSVALARGLDVSTIEISDGDAVGETFGIARAMACEIAYENDECSPMYARSDDGEYKRMPPETDGERWQRMRKWVDGQIRK